jgi:hypothetical protein
MDLKKYLFSLENPRHSNKWISGKELIEYWDIRDFELFDLMKKGLQAYNSYGKKITDSDSLERAPRYTLDQTEGLIRGIEVTRRVLGKPGTFQRPRSEWEIKAEARKAYEAQSLEIVNPPKDHELMSFSIPQNRKMADKMLSMGRSFLFRIEEALNFEKEQGLNGLSNYLEISPPKQKTDLNNEVPEGETPTNGQIAFPEIEKLCSTDNQETEAPDVKKYIDKCLADGVPKEKIAVELKNNYKLSFLEIGRLLNPEGLNSGQVAALKQRGQRLHKKGLESNTGEKRGKKAKKR